MSPVSTVTASSQLSPAAGGRRPSPAGSPRALSDGPLSARLSSEEPLSARFSDTPDFPGVPIIEAGGRLESLNSTMEAVPPPDAKAEDPSGLADTVEAEGGPAPVKHIYTPTVVAPRRTPTSSSNEPSSQQSTRRTVSFVDNKAALRVDSLMQRPWSMATQVTDDGDPNASMLTQAPDFAFPPSFRRDSVLERTYSLPRCRSSVYSVVDSLWSLELSWWAQQVLRYWGLMAALTVAAWLGAMSAWDDGAKSLPKACLPLCSTAGYSGPAMKGSSHVPDPQVSAPEHAAAGLRASSGSPGSFWWYVWELPDLLVNLLNVLTVTVTTVGVAGVTSYSARWIVRLQQHTIAKEAELARQDREAETGRYRT